MGSGAGGGQADSGRPGEGGKARTCQCVFWPVSSAVPLTQVHFSPEEPAQQSYPPLVSGLVQKSAPSGSLHTDGVDSESNSEAVLIRRPIISSVSIMPPEDIETN